MRRETTIYFGLIMAVACLIYIDNNALFSDIEVEKVFDLNQYDLTEIDLECDVFVTEGDNGKLVLQANQAVAKNLVTENDDRTLSIKEPASNVLLKWLNLTGLVDKKVKIYINHDQLDKIRISDRATIISMDYDKTKAPSYNQAEKSGGNSTDFLSNFQVSAFRKIRFDITRLIPII